MRIPRALLALSLALSLALAAAGCGGGSSSSSTAATLSPSSLIACLGKKGLKANSSQPTSPQVAWNVYLNQNQPNQVFVSFLPSPARAKRFERAFQALSSG